jgi:hypothetical protein
VDDTGAALANPTKLLRLKGGLGLVGNSGKYYQYIEATQRFTIKDQLPDYNVSGADQVVSSGPANTPKIRWVASSTKFHAVIYEIGPGVTFDQGWRLVLYDRNAFGIILTVNLGEATGATCNNAKCVFVADRYLHVYTAGTGVKALVYDTAATPIAAVAAVLAVAGAPATLVDVDATTDRSFVLTNNAGTTTLRSTLNTGAASTSSNTTTSPALGISCFSTSLWYFTATQAGSRSTTNLATIVTAEAAHGFTNPLYFVATGTAASSFTMVGQTAVAFGTSTINRITIFIGGTLYGTFDGWTIGSAPWLDSASTNKYMHIVKSSGLTVTAHAVMKISYKGLQVVNQQLLQLSASHDA